MLADVAVEGTTLHLKDIAVFPRSVQRLDLGTKEILKVRRQLATEAKAAGFATLRIIGKRLSGAKPGRAVDVTMDLI